MLLAIYAGRVFDVGDNLNACDLLDRETRERVLTVDFDDPMLLVDPTDAQLDATIAGEPLPPESCAVCHEHPHHEHEWNYYTQDGYGVCDDCGREGRRRFPRHITEARRRG